MGEQGHEAHTPAAASRGTLQAYIIGFLLSLALTLTGFVLAEAHVRSHHLSLSHHVLVPVILSLAIVQFFGQLFFFLHLGKEGRPRWNLIAFLLMITVVLIVVIGSLWIMDNLNYHMMSLHDVYKYMNSQDGL